VGRIAGGLTATALSGSGWTTDLATLTATRSDVLTAGSSYPALTLTVSVAANAPASVTNTATVSGGGRAEHGQRHDQRSDDHCPDRHCSLELGWGGRRPQLMEDTPGATPTVIVSQSSGYDPLLIDLGAGHVFAGGSTVTAPTRPT